MRHSKAKQQLLTRDPESEGKQAKGNHTVPLQIPALPFCQSVLVKESACKMQTICQFCDSSAILTLVLPAVLGLAAAAVRRISGTVAML